MQFWTVPDRAGLPTVDAEAIVGAGGVNPNTGKGALIRLDPGTTLADGGPFIKLEWAGATVAYDDLGFFDDSVGFVIPDVNPPIKRVRMWTALVWPPVTGTLGVFHGFVGGNVPFTGGGFNEPSAAANVSGRWRTVLVSAPFEFDKIPFGGLPLNAFVGQATGGVVILSGQQMAIEVVR